VRAACALLSTTACAATLAPQPLRNQDLEPAGAEVEVRFEATTIAFAARGGGLAAGLPTRVDDRPCPAGGPAWFDAEDAVLAAFEVARRRDPFLAEWRSSDPLRVERSAHVKWLDADLLISRRRHRGDRAVDAALRITGSGGYLLVWGPPGVEVFCFDVVLTRAATVLVPRVVDATDF
jgi:hypothetical protein